MPTPGRARSIASGADRISDLPDGVIHHVLSLLPAHDAFDPRDFDFDFYELAQKLRSRRWIWYALCCNVRVLRLSLDDMAAFPLARVPLFSRYLTKLELDCVETNNSVLDLSGCPVLVEVKMEYCFINADEISSASLKKLTMKECEFRRKRRTRISLPSLISLVTLYSGRAPLLGSMPSLESAIVSLNYGWEDHCDCDEDSCDGCRYYYIPDDDGTSCVLLNGLSEATHLQLSSYPDVFVFCRDVKRCPKFTNLKTLVLSDWCLAADLNALICFLQHSPTLEKLTLQLSGVPECSMEQEGSYKLLEPSYISHHLKMMVIKCEEVDGRVHKIIKTLSEYGIPLEHINMQQTNRSSGSGCE
ncbi:hypothetical protein EJB05_34939, partial [Eragrostis curvula]